MIIKTIIVMCMSNYGLNISNWDNYTLTAPKLSKCVDRVAACYYKGKHKDVFECLQKSMASE
jgi:hypothetical protein